MEQSHPAEVPCLVRRDLLRNKLIPDPLHRDNEKSLQWIGLTDWEYQTEFKGKSSPQGTAPELRFLGAASALKR